MNIKSKIITTLVMAFLYCPIASLTTDFEIMSQTTIADTNSANDRSEPVGL